MRIHPPILPLLLLLSLVACGEPEADAPEAVTAVGGEAVPAEDPAQVRGTIESVNTQFVEALNRGDVPGFVQVYTEDATIYPPELPPMEGREQIQRYWETGVQQMGVREVSLTTDEVEVFGDTAYEVGRFSFNTNQGPAQGKYLVIWKRQPDGSWRWYRDIWNSSPAA